MVSLANANLYTNTVNKFVAWAQCCASGVLQLRRDVLEESVEVRLSTQWHQRFAEERKRLDDDERTGRPTTVQTERKIEEVAMVVRANRSKLVDDIAAAVRISHGTCHKILTDDLNMSRVTQHSVQRMLTQDQLEERMTICGDLISSADADGTFLNRIITGDET